MLGIRNTNWKILVTISFPTEWSFRRRELRSSRRERVISRRAGWVGGWMGRRGCRSGEGNRDDGVGGVGRERRERRGERDIKQKYLFNLSLLIFFLLQLLFLRFFSFEIYFFWNRFLFLESRKTDQTLCATNFQLNRMEIKQIETKWLCWEKEMGAGWVESGGGGGLLLGGWMGFGGESSDT